MIVIIMGVSGAGKTTTGKLLAHELGWRYAEGDEFHPQANVAKMRAGKPLDDDDRRLWLQRLHQAIDDWVSVGENVVLACSALKEAYRSQLCTDPQQVRFAYLKLDFDAVKERLSARQNHFMPVSLLESQFDTLEEPGDQSTVDAAGSPEQVVDRIRNKLGL